MIRLEGADRYTFNGQFEGDGNRWLEFSHDKEDQSVFYFYDDATYNIIQNITIIGAEMLIPRGTIYFDSTTVASPVGNDNNVINCSAGT